MAVSMTRSEIRAAFRIKAISSCDLISPLPVHKRGDVGKRGVGHFRHKHLMRFGRVVVVLHLDADLG